jgi:hypothetical protein
VQLLYKGKCLYEREVETMEAGRKDSKGGEEEKFAIVLTGIAWVAQFLTLDQWGTLRQFVPQQEIPLVQARSTRQERIVVPSAANINKSLLDCLLKVML